MKKTIITVVGKDTVGIIAKVCNYLAENQVNIENALCFFGICIKNTNLFPNYSRYR